MCGDNASLSRHKEDIFYNHRKLFEFFKKKFNCPIGFVSGNHDLWTAGRIPSKEILYKGFSGLAKEMELVYLEKENMNVKGFVFAGTYGHYDYSLGKTNEYIKRENFISQKAVIGNHSYSWDDREMMDWQGEGDERICFELMKGFEKRARNKKNLITISHMIPSMKLCGHEPSLKQDFFGAFSGSWHLENIIEKSKPLFHFCGHTHAYAEALIGKTQVFNVGSDYDNMSYLILDTETQKVSRMVHNF
jgi:hypothetical protein